MKKILGVIGLVLFISLNASQNKIPEGRWVNDSYIVTYGGLNIVLDHRPNYEAFFASQKKQEKRSTSPFYTFWVRTSKKKALVD